MAQISLPGLLPNTKYNVQVRSKAGTDLSEWSKLFTFDTSQDHIAPNAPTNLKWGVGIGSFIGTWDAPVTNTDGSDVTDLKDYRVLIIGTDVNNNQLTNEYFVTESRFEFTMEMNKAIYGLQTPAKSLQISVQARDEAGNLSAAVTATAAKQKPGAPTNFVATGIQEGINCTWTASPDATVDHYEIFMSHAAPDFTPTVPDRYWWGYGEKTTIDTSGDYALFYLALCAVDAFGDVSDFVRAQATPKSSFVVDTNAPVEVTNVVGTGVPEGISVTWTPSTDTDVQNYVIRYRVTGTTDWSYLTFPGEVSNAPNGGPVIIPNLMPGQSYDLGVAANDWTGNFSAYVSPVGPVVAGADTVPPATPAAPAIAANTMQIQVAHNGLQADNATRMDLDVDVYEVYASTTTGFTPDDTNILGRIKALPNGVAVGTFPVPATAASGTTQTWYAVVKAVDLSGNKSPASAQSSASVPLVAAANIQDATITNAKISDLAANKITAGTGFVNDLSVKSTFTMQTGGTMQSANYVQGVSGWRLQNNTLELNDGTIAAKMLLLQAGKNIMKPEYSDFEFATRFYTTSVITNATTWSIDVATYKYGSQSLKLAPSGVTNYRLAIDDTRPNGVGVDGGSNYIMSAWVNNATASAATVTLQAKRGDDNAFSGTSVSVPANSGWVRISTVIATNAATLWATPYIQSDTAINVDAVQFEQQTGSATTPSQYGPPSFTSIDGGAIKTGSIQSTATQTTGGVTVPMWSINMAGNAQFGNALVRGRLIIGQSGDAAADQAAMSVSSWNFNAGSAGWAIKGDGSAEFNNGTFRGTVVVSAGGSSVPGSVVAGQVGSANTANSATNSTNATNLTGGTVSGTNQVSGLIQVGNAGSAHIDIGYNSSTGFSGFRQFASNGSTVMVELNNANGNATFTGTVNATGGDFGTGTVNGGNFYGSTFQTGPLGGSNPAIRIKDSRSTGGDPIEFYKASYGSPVGTMTGYADSTSSGVYLNTPYAVLGQDGLAKVNLQGQIIRRTANAVHSAFATCTNMAGDGPYTTDASGNIAITFPQAFPSGYQAVMVWCNASTYRNAARPAHVISASNTGFTVNLTNGATALASQSNCYLTWIAMAVAG